VAETLSSVRHALKILQLLRLNSALGVTEVSAALGVGGSTAHRLLTTLQSEGFVQQQDRGRKYELGPAMGGGGRTTAVEHCVEVSYPFLRDLRDKCGETVHISVLTGRETRFVAVIESNQVMRVTSRVGVRLPAHTTAAGKMQLALLDQEELLRLYPDEELPGRTDRSMRTRSQLFAQLKVARRNNYARNLSESEAGMAALAVPLHRPSGPVLCCLTVSGPESRLNPEGTAKLSNAEQRLLVMLREEARLIERHLSF
jgi:DNA-binding IclR family transcriptional regulator